jgi:hypothetical protein
VPLTAATPLESVVRLPIAPLRGGITLQEVRAVEAAPSATRTDSLGTYWSFGHDGLGIELAHLQYRDSGPVDKWVVRAAPKENTVAALLSPELAALVSRAGGITELTIHEQQRPRLQAFAASVQAGRLRDLEWYSIEGMPGG